MGIEAPLRLVSVMLTNGLGNSRRVGPFQVSVVRIHFGVILVVEVMGTFLKHLQGGASHNA